MRTRPAQHEPGPPRRVDRFAGRAAGDRGEHEDQQDVQDERDHLGHAHAGRRDRGGDLLALQVPDVQRGPADRGGGHQRDEGAGQLGEHGAAEAQPAGDEPDQCLGGGGVGGRRQGQRGDGPAPVRLVQHAPEAGPLQLAGQQVDGGDAGDQRQQGTRPDALQPGRGDLAARHRREQPGAQRGQHVAAAAQRLAGRAGQRDRLQQRHHRHQVVRAQLRHRQPGGAVRPDDKGKLGDELGHVQADLQVAGCHVAVARVEQHGLAVAGEQDAIRGQAPVRDLAGVQPAAASHIWLSSASLQPAFRWASVVPSWCS